MKQERIRTSRSLTPVGLLLSLLFGCVTVAQTGGNYDLSKNVVASGGGSSAGSSFTLNGTTAQPAAGSLLGTPPFSQSGGFWQTANNQPTAAPATISGKVITSMGAPLGGVLVILSGSFSGRAITDANGNYSFENFPTNELYVATPSLANYTFTPANRSFTLLANVINAIFTALPDDIAQANPLDTPEFFVRQQYLDFLGREPDRVGLSYWANLITSCSSADQRCADARRVATADAFFFEREFQDTGGFVYRIYKASLGANPSFTQFQPDVSVVVGGTNLELGKTVFVRDFVTRRAFLQKYPRSQTADEFVDSLLLTIRTESGVDLAPQHDSLVLLYDGSDDSRARILSRVAAESAFVDTQYDQSFVLTEYFGFLRRDPDPAGYDFWLHQVDRFPLRNVSIQQAMVCSFITSAEYQQRFSPIVTHNNFECK